MPVFDWFGHYKNRFGLKWHIVEIPYRIVDLEVLANFETILGVGSGRALFENLLSKNKSIIASDVSPALMHLAKKHGKNIKGFMACDVFSLPFKDQSFDCVYSQGLMEHFEETEAADILREMGRAAEYAVFSVPLHTYRGQPLEFEYHRRPEEWLKILSTVFRFRKALPYPTRTEAVFMASQKQLPKIKRFKTLEILKNAVAAS
jgi:ubiquinone/menaquinone biosynthesis C-methylase UbiE